MEFSDRVKKVIENCRKRAMDMPEETFEYDMNHYAENKYSHLGYIERFVRSMADALRNRKIYIYPEDRIIGRAYQLKSKPVENPSIVRYMNFVEYLSKPEGKVLADSCPEYKELMEYQLIDGGFAPGHITWDWNRLLKNGTENMKNQCREAIGKTEDAKTIQFHEGVIIMLEALEDWNDKHAEELEKLGMNELAQLCRKVPRYPAETFHEAVQAFYMQYLAVMSENPYGGNGPGRLDYFLWPYLKRDLELGRCTMDEARDIITELFVRLDERIHEADTWVEVVMVGGTTPDGASAVNPLSYMMIEIFMELNITHPAVYVRVSENSPEDFVKLCGEYMIKGGNRAQILNDENIIKALTKAGAEYSDAVDYVCGGCMEIGMQGKNSDFLYNGWYNVVKLVELAVTGGFCLRSGNKVNGVNFKGLEKATDFEEFYREFIGELERIVNIFFKAQDLFSENYAAKRPSYLMSSMIDNCMQKGRNMHDGGAKYHDYGSTPLGLPNAADYLFAVKKAVFDDKICSAEELINALKANFEGYENLRKKLAALPKYGQENKEADSIMERLCSDIGDIYSKYRNRHGGRAKIVILTFVWAPVAAKVLGATACGQFAETTVAHGVTPQSAAMINGVTAAMNSCKKVPFDMFDGGASTMWDFDPAWINPELMTAFIKTFFQNGGQIFQGNVVDSAILEKAMDSPEDYPNLIVRVGGYSARFAQLPEDIKKEIINRYKHNK